MTAGEDQSEQLTSLPLPGPRIGFAWLAGKAGCGWPDGSQQRQLLLTRTFPAQLVDCLTPGGGGQPAARVRRRALGAPVLKRLDERGLDRLFRQPVGAE